MTESVVEFQRTCSQHYIALHNCSWIGWVFSIPYSMICGDTHTAALLPLSIHQSTLRPSQQQLNHHSKPLSHSLLLWLLPQRKRPLTNGSTFWKPRPSALPTSQWQSRLTSSDLHKRSHLTGEKQFILKGVTVHNTSGRKLCKTHQDRRPDASWTAHTTAHPGKHQASSMADRLLLHITPQRRQETGPIASHLAGLTHYTPCCRP